MAFEATANSWEIARILEGHVARVIVVSPSEIAQVERLIAKEA